MKFTIPTKTFFAEASAVAKVLASKNTLAILNYFLITVKDNKMVIRGTDSECTITNTIELPQTQAEGSVCIQADLLLEALHLMGDSIMEMEVDDDTHAIHITYEGGSSQMMGLPADQFPDIRKQDEGQDVGETTTLTLPAQALLKGLRNTVFAVSAEDFRPVMTGVCLDFKDDRLVMAATDAHKLSRWIDTNVHPGFERTCIMPARSVAIVNTLFEDAADVTLTINERRCFVESVDRIFTFPFIKGRFPDYNRVIPADNPFTLTIDRESTLAAAKRVAVFADKGTQLMRIDLSSDQIELSCQDTAYSNRANETVKASYDGEAVAMAFKAGYLEEVLATLTSPDVIVRIKDPARAAVFEPAANDPGTELTILLMPLQVPA